MKMRANAMVSASLRSQTSDGSCSGLLALLV